MITDVARSSPKAKQDDAGSQFVGKKLLALSLKWDAKLEIMDILFKDPIQVATGRSQLSCPAPLGQPMDRGI